MTLPGDPQLPNDPQFEAPLPAAWTQPAPEPDLLVYADGGWQPLPVRARRLWTVGYVLAGVLIALAACVPLGLLLRPVSPSLAVAGALLLLLVLPVFGAWRARKRWKYTQWRLDALGFSLRRGRMWFSEVCIPGARVQHLDIKRGPLERRFDLATLVIHTAGTREHALQVSGLDAADAKDLRDRLAVQLDDVHE